MGLDLAYRRSGWALLAPNGSGDPALVDCGVVIPAGRGRSAALFDVQQQLAQVIRARYPRAVFMEQPGYWMRGRIARSTVELLAKVRGVASAACAMYGLEAVEVDFQTVRRALMGTGRPSAEAVVDFVKEQGYQLPRLRSGRADRDIANAIMMALYGLAIAGLEDSSSTGAGSTHR